ncbi:MAG: response regulator transcription factor [Clostridia bacterium]|nr:response regulator transcription factor [Clostridia bacterium]
MALILIVEDELLINKLIAKNLTLMGHECLSVYDGGSVEALIKERRPDLIILDVMLPGLSGFDLIKLVGDIPVIFVTAKAGLADRLTGLSLGGEDYIVKPFEMQELLARVNVVLRRVKRNTDTLTVDGVTIDFGSRRVYRDGVGIGLTSKEFALLEVLVQNRNIALSRDKLLDLVWGYDYSGDSRTVDVHVQQLRKKLGWKERINTIYKVGYRFDL